MSNPKWLRTLTELPTADEASLRRSLLTRDGLGVQFKEACLNELIKRAAKKEGDR